VVADGQHRPRAIRERRFERAQDLAQRIGPPRRLDELVRGELEVLLVLLGAVVAAGEREDQGIA
jgi:hypothetical protein